MNDNRLFLCTVLFLSLAAYPLSGSGRHGFNHYSVEDGMSHSTVEAILQDRTGFMWLGTGNGLNKFDGHNFSIYGNHHVTSLVEDADGTIWTGTTEGLFLFNPGKETFTPFDRRTPEGTTIGKEVDCMSFDDEGILWIGTADEGLFRYDNSTNTLTRVHAVGGSGIFGILPDANGVIYLATDKGFVRYDIRWNRCTVYDIPGRNTSGVYCLEEENNDAILLGCKDGGIFRFDKKTGLVDAFLGEIGALPVPRMISKVGKDELWIGTESGLFIYNTHSGNLERILQNLSEKTSISGNAIRSLCEDKEGGIWIGTYLGGVNYTSTEQNFIIQFCPSISPDGLHAHMIREFAEEGNGTLWFGTEDDGLYRFERTSGLFRNWSSQDGSLPWHNVSALMLDGDSLYIGLQRHGICIMDIPSGSIRSYPGQAGIPDNISAIFKDNLGRILVGTKVGLFLFHPENGSFTGSKVTDPGNAVYDIMEDHLGRLWLATREGLLSYDAKSGIKCRYRAGTESTSLSSDKTISIMEDSHRQLWIGTEDGGACRFNPETEAFDRFDQSNGLPSNTVYEILEDQDGNIWFSTGKGLSRLSAETGSFITYSYNYGTPADQFNYRSAIKTRDGKLYFGTVRGFMEVTPEDLHTNYAPPKVVFTGWSVPGEDYTLEPAETILPGLKFKHDHGNITFRFAALSYTAPQNNKYAYRLRGLDKEWTYTKNTSIHYTRIPPGKYYLEVMGSNGDGIWSERPTSLRLVVKPPFLSSWPGILLEIALGIGALIGFYLSQRRRMQEKNRLEIERFREAEALATQKSRIDFFTSIIHEIRTPLSLIKAPFEQIKKGNLGEDEYKEDMDMIGQNIDRLMMLSNEILDFSRIEVNAFQLRPRMTQVKHIAEEVLRNFTFAAKEKGLVFDKVLPEEDVNARIDPEILIKILTNLLANATKFAESRIEFRMEDEEGKIKFIISNDGQIIAPEDRERIFTPFFREERDDLAGGTGLGLPLVRKLTELHQGTIRLDTTDPTRNTLLVEIPKLANKDETEAEHGPDSSSESLDPVKRAIAIVDDNPQICQYLKRAFSKEYNVIGCADAKELYEVLRQNLVDLVISDIMMPGTDGITLCRELKGSFEYSHIPIILLSAKVDSDTKIEGLNAGADAFVEKPFTMDFLMKQVQNIFSRLDRTRDYYARNTGVEETTPPGSPSDRAFMEKISDIITEHLSEEDFSIDRIADIVGMSRSTLYRKIRGITQLPPGELIKVVRLNKAAEMLRSGNYRVSEVGFLVGFNSVSYFSTCFHKQFGLSPKEYMGK